MKDCPACAARVPEHASVCPTCSHAFAPGEGLPATRLTAEAAHQLVREEHLSTAVGRPNGSVLVITGVALLVLGTVLTAIAWLSDVEYRFALWLLSGAAMNLGVLLWALGTLVRAIFFLPGRTVTLGDLRPS